MKNKVKEVMGIDDKITLAIIVLSILVLIISFINSVNHQRYIFTLNGEEVESFLICDDYWNYEDVNFIPCIWDGNLSAIPQPLVNWSSSPIDNCKRWNGTFPGFNVYNETRAKEIYDSTIPKCYEVTNEDNIEDWINKNCICMDFCNEQSNLCLVQQNDSIREVEGYECKKYNCGDLDIAEL